VVLLEDECHLLWGDCCGFIWGKCHETIPVPISNIRQRQTYYGALNLLTKTFHLKEFDKGNSLNTVAYVQELQALYPGKKLWLLWENASYHRFAEMPAFLATVNNGLLEEDWHITCIPFATDAPEQNPVEDIWLAGKNFLRKNFTRNKTFANVKECFVQFLSSLSFDSRKLDWYYPQII
jgi:transposase